MADVETYTKTFTSFSGADIKCVMGDKMLMECQGISYSVTREQLRPQVVTLRREGGLIRETSARNGGGNPEYPPWDMHRLRTQSQILTTTNVNLKLV